MPPTEMDAPVSVGKPNPRNNPVMFKIFQNVQYNVVQHKKYVKEMRKLYKKLDQDTFRESFKNALHYLFTFGDSSANVDRVIQFVSTFCTTLDDEEEFLMFIFEIIFDCQCVSGQAVRYRASQLLAAVLSALGDDASLDDDLCDKLLKSQLDRLQDTRGAVRCRAALALQRLQNPAEPDDEVTRAYRFHMSCDPSSSVRRAILMSIAKYVRNVPFVLVRLCDVDEAVRRAAFLYISAISVTQLRVRQRVLTLKVGLTERSPRVRRVVEEIVIPGWLSSFQGNIIDLLKAIRLDNAQDAKDSQYVAGKLLESLFKRLPISELLEWLPTDKTHRLIPGEKLSKETAWYWRHLAEHLQRIDDDETLETVLPELVVFTGYIRAILESPCPSESEDPVMFSTRQHVLHELGSMLRVYDASDPPGRAALKDLITDALTGEYGPLSADVIRAFVGALEMVVPDVGARVEMVCGVVSALAVRDAADAEESPPPPPPPVDSTEVKMQRARLRVSLNVAIEAQEEAVRDENYALAAECKAKVAEIQKKLEELNVQALPPPPPMQTIKEKQPCDSVTLNKCLTILNCALDTPQLKCITPVLQLTFNELEAEIFQNPNIRDTALETVALFGMLDKEFAINHKAFFFANLVDLSNEHTTSTVLKCVVDLFCVHGARVFEESCDVTGDTSSAKKRNTKHSIDTEADGTISESALSLSPHSTVIELLLKIMDDPCPPYRLIIVEGLCRLIYLGHLVSPAILSRLLLLWFNPATVEEDVLRQTIGVFFQTFPTSVDGAQEQIQKATLPTLRALANAPSNSPLSEIDQEAVVRFIVSLTRVNHELIDSQGAMAVVLCGYLARRPACPEAALACRMLALLSPPRDALTASDLAVTLRDLCLVSVSVQLVDSQGAMAVVLCGYLARRPACPEAALACRMLALLSPPRDALTASDLAVTLRDLCLVSVSVQLVDSQGAMAVVLCGYLARRPACPEAALACRMLALLSPPRDALTASDLAVTLRDLCLVSVSVQLVDSQGAMAVVLCGYLARRPACPEAALACRMLALLSPPRDALTASDLAVTLRDLCLKLPDKQSVRNLTRYLGALEDRASISKASNIGVTEGTIQAEDTMTTIGRNTSSLPQPLARSTHVVINETLQEEPEIDETSPSEIVAARESEENQPSEIRQSAQEGSDIDVVPTRQASGSSSDSSGVSPVKKAKVTKSKKKKASLTESDPDFKDSKPSKSKAAKEKTRDKEQKTKGVKRSRSERSRENVDKGKASTKSTKEQATREVPPPDRSLSPDDGHANVTIRSTRAQSQSSPGTDSSSSSRENKRERQMPALDDLDVSNVTVRRSTRGPAPSDTNAGGSKKSSKNKRGKGNNSDKEANRRASRSPVESRGSAGVTQDDSADETTLHTIVYDNDIEQELLNDSSELVDGGRASKPNVTIAETPDASEESEPEDEMPMKGKGKRK